jgi:hypothetical protein
MIYLIKDGDLITPETREIADIFIAEGYIEYPENSKEVKDLLRKIYLIKRIPELKAFLATSDWKVIVNAELYQAGLPLKYPNLHAERQAWRNEINQLEFEISMLGN